MEEEEGLVDRELRTFIYPEKLKVLWGKLFQALCYIERVVVLEAAVMMAESVFIIEF
jgi:hypothetical protein